jgi:predicted nucleic acid-binding Zn ribbon protein
MTKMSVNRDEDIRELHEQVARRQYYQKSPQRIADTLSTLMARRGYAQLEATQERESAWKSAVGDPLACHTRVGNIRRGIVEVIVSNSAALQELTFRKAELMGKLATALPDQKIKDVRFRIGTLS